MGLSKQIAVLAYQFGNRLLPTASAHLCALCCGLRGGVPLNKWYRFVTPLFLMMLALEFVFMTSPSGSAIKRCFCPRSGVK